MNRDDTSSLVVVEVVETRWGWRAGEREKPLNGVQLGVSNRSKSLKSR